MQVVDALIKADKDFDLVVFPGAGHGAGGGPYGERRRARLLRPAPARRRAAPARRPSPGIDDGPSPPPGRAFRADRLSCLIPRGPKPGSVRWKAAGWDDESVRPVRPQADRDPDQGDGGGERLHRVLGPVALTALGVGATIGAGIFVLTGEAATNYAGPSLILSFLLAGIGCGLAALCYSELASMVPVAGSAYTYAYATLGELVAWIIGWDLILEYAIGSAAVAVGWSNYLAALFRNQFRHRARPAAGSPRPGTSTSSTHAFFWNGWRSRCADGSIGRGPGFEPPGAR